VTTVSSTGGDTTLTASQRRSNIIKVTGTLVSNVVLIFSNENQSFKIWNATTDGGFAVTCKTAAGTGEQIATIPTSCVRNIWCDGADGVWRTDIEDIGGVHFVLNGQPNDPAGYYTLPAAAVDIPRNGIYRELFRLYGTFYGAGNGSTTFGSPTTGSFAISGMTVYLRL
jgi:hypothetical protein